MQVIKKMYSMQYVFNENYKYSKISYYSSLTKYIYPDFAEKVCNANFEKKI